MRIGCLQFAPRVGDVDNNLSRADVVLEQAAPESLDLLVLPELAFSGYNFKSLQEITPFLEDPQTGITSLWAKSTALKQDCTVIAGYPEKADSTLRGPAEPQYYNSATIVSADGEPAAKYRKSHLYYTDETWALEGSGFYGGTLPGLGQTAMGICMDINPYKFEAPWDKFEFAQHALETKARVVVVSMAWITQADPEVYTKTPEMPDMDTLTYWMARLDPLVRSEPEEEVIVVFANRCGQEGDSTYAGTSAVVGILGKEVKVYGILGRGESDLLVVDTDDLPYAKLVFRPLDSVPVSAEEEGAASDSSRPTSASESNGSEPKPETSKISNVTSPTSTESKDGHGDADSLYQRRRLPPLSLRDDKASQLEEALASSPQVVAFSPADSNRSFFDEYQHPITPVSEKDLWWPEQPKQPAHRRYHSTSSLANQSTASRRNRFSKSRASMGSVLSERAAANRVARRASVDPTHEELMLEDVEYDDLASIASGHSSHLPSSKTKPPPKTNRQHMEVREWLSSATTSSTPPLREMPSSRSRRRKSTLSYINDWDEPMSRAPLDFPTPRAMTFEEASAFSKPVVI